MKDWLWNILMTIAVVVVIASVLLRDVPIVVYACFLMMLVMLAKHGR